LAELGVSLQIDQKKIEEKKAFTFLYDVVQYGGVVVAAVVQTLTTDPDTEDWEGRRA
jgi:hypothetical protein